MEIIPILIGLLTLGILCFAVYKVLIKKKKVGTMYTPYDDFTRGTHDTNSSQHLEEDTRHAIPMEEKRSSDE